MAKHGFVQYLPEILGGAALLASGAGAAGIGPLAGLFGAGGAAAGLGGAADLGAAGAGLGGAADAAGSFLLPGADTALAGAAGSAIDLPASLAGTATDALGSAGSAIGAAAGAPNFMGALTDMGPASLPPVGGSAAGLPGVTATPLDATAAPMGGLATPSAGLSGGGGGGGDGSAAPSASNTNNAWWQDFLQPKNLVGLAPLALAAGEHFMNNQVPGSAPVTQAAQQNAQTQGMLTGQAGQNLSYINTGALPAGAQSTIDNAANAQKAQVRSAFASMGVPPGSTAEAQELGAVDANKASQAFDMQQKLLQSGVAEANVGGSYGTLVNQEDLALMNAQIQQNEQLNAAIANFAKAFA